MNKLISALHDLLHRVDFAFPQVGDNIVTLQGRCFSQTKASGIHSGKDLSDLNRQFLSRITGHKIIRFNISFNASGLHIIPKSVLTLNTIQNRRCTMIVNATHNLAIHRGGRCAHIDEAVHDGNLCHRNILIR